VTRSVVADFKHALALWPGTRDEAEERLEALRRRCKALNASEDADLYLRVLTVGDGVDELEMDHMEETRRVPRRVMARFQQGVFK